MFLNMFLKDWYRDSIEMHEIYTIFIFYDLYLTKRFIVILNHQTKQ